MKVLVFFIVIGKDSQKSLLRFLHFFCFLIIELEVFLM